MTWLYWAHFGFLALLVAGACWLAALAWLYDS
jgi:hypothetical protein